MTEKEKILKEVKTRLLCRAIKVSTVKGIKPGGKTHVYITAVGTKEINRVIDAMLEEIT